MNSNTAEQPKKESGVKKKVGIGAAAGAGLGLVAGVLTGAIIPDLIIGAAAGGLTGLAVGEATKKD